MKGVEFDVMSAMSCDPQSHDQKSEQEGREFIQPWIMFNLKVLKAESRRKKLDICLIIKIIIGWCSNLIRANRILSVKHNYRP